MEHSDHFVIQSFHNTDIWLHCFQLEAENNVVVLLDQTERTTGDTITVDYMLGKLSVGWVFFHTVYGVAAGWICCSTLKLVKRVLLPDSFQLTVIPLIPPPLSKGCFICSKHVFEITDSEIVSIHS